MRRIAFTVDRESLAQPLRNSSLPEDIRNLFCKKYSQGK